MVKGGAAIGGRPRAGFTAVGWAGLAASFCFFSLTGFDGAAAVFSAGFGLGDVFTSVGTGDFEAGFDTVATLFDCAACASNSAIFWRKVARAFSTASASAGVCAETGGVVEYIAGGGVAETDGGGETGGAGVTGGTAETETGGAGETGFEVGTLLCVADEV